MKEYILASASPRRREILEQLGLDFDIIVSTTDEEKIDKNLPINLYVEELAMAKASSAAGLCVAQNRKSGLIIAADTIVYCDGKILGKPKDRDDAFNMLNKLSGRTHEVLTGICVMRLKDGFSVAAYEKTNVHFKPLSPVKIWRYIDSGEPMDKAGAYGIQGLGAMLVEKIEGDYFNVVGLPVSKLVSVLEKEFGVEIL